MAHCGEIIEPFPVPQPVGYATLSSNPPLFIRDGPLDDFDIAMQRIAEESERKTGILDLGDLELAELPPALARLTHLRRLNLGSGRFDEDGRFLHGIGPRPLKHIDQLSTLTALQFLSLADTEVSDLAPLSGLTALQSLDCTFTEVSDLAPLSRLTALQKLDCVSTGVSDLAPLSGLTALQTLHCSFNKVSDLAALRRLTALQDLACSHTRISDLLPLSGLTALQAIYCSFTEIGDLAPLRRLTALQNLDCSHTKISDLLPLRHIAALRRLDCSDTEISDLAPLVDLPDLRKLNCSRCRLREPVAETFWFKPSLIGLILHDSKIPGLPAEVLSQTAGENCLDSLRAHLRDCAAGREPMADVKLMVLGNGRIGKTQICRRLRGEDYDPRVVSTHGVTVTSAPLPGADDDGRLQIWDFGGQDIYHGTHALFMRSRAVFLLVWIPEADNTDEYQDDGIRFRNQPLAYWLDYVRQFGGAASSVLVVQTRCDRPEHEAVRPPLTDAALAGFPFRKLLHYSALANRGRAALDEALAEATAWLRERQGTAEIGKGRMRVKRRLEAMRDADAAQPAALRRARTISPSQFLALCEEEGGVTDTAQLLTYLHNAGTLFHRDGLFDDRIILDQGWALEAIYAVFHREKVLKKLRRQSGRFTRSDLADWLWDAEDHSAADQELLLSMMQSCGICFVHRPAQPGKDIEAEYIAPDLLPEKAALARQLDQKWDAELACAEAEFGYPLLPPGLMGALISRVGGEAGLDADYWRGGFYVYEATTGSRAMIEQTVTDGWQGRIRIAAQRGQAAVLVERLTTLLRQEEQRIGIQSTALSLTPSGRPGAQSRLFNRARQDGSTPASAEAAPALAFAQEPAEAPEWCVSYAWGDDTAEGRERETIVDRLCAAAAARGIAILRDKTALGLGDRISKFMRRLGRADRLFVILSDKYLKSPYCMTELCELWLHCREDETELLSRIRVYTLADARIFSPFDRTQYAVYWKQEYQRLADLVALHGDEILGEKDAHQYRLMKKFARQIGDILSTVADILQPRDFEQLERYGFE
jgi:internalin A